MAYCSKVIFWGCGLLQQGYIHGGGGVAYCSKGVAYCSNVIFIGVWLIAAQEKSCGHIYGNVAYCSKVIFMGVWLIAAKEQS